MFRSPKIFSTALAHHQAGRLDAAARIYRKILAAMPGHADSLHLLGVIAYQRGRHDEALGLISKAVALRPNFPEAYSNLGLVFHGQGNLAEAAACYGRTVAIRPDHPEAHYNHGILLQEQGKLSEAAASFDRALALKPDHADAHTNMGILLQQQGKLSEAAVSFGRALALRPNDPSVHYNLGNLRRDQGKSIEAIACYERAIALKPNYPEAHNNLGNVHQSEGRLVEAVACYERVLALKPEHASTHNNLGNAFRAQGRLVEAMACFDRAIAFEPSYAEAHNNLGIVLRTQGMLSEAMVSYNRALALEPDHAGARNNLGNALQADGRLVEAVSCFDRALALEPDFPEAHHNRAMALLLAGKFDEGWRDYEWRSLIPHLAKAQRKFAQPQWRGEPAQGRVLLIHAEQGFGDTLQFCRYVPLVAALGIRVLLEVPAPLVRLLRRLPDVEQIIACGEALPAFDLHCPMLSLPLAFGTRLDTIPGQSPYLTAEPSAAEIWRNRLDGGEPHLKVGLVWAGNPRSHSPDLAAVDRRRSIGADRLAPLLKTSGVRFYSLQKDGPRAPGSFGLIDLMGETRDFADTAALVTNLDLVISVDTAVAHLAAALGRPVWLLNRYDTCWRWLLDRTDSPWYPTLRQFRQPGPGDWDSVMREVGAALVGLVAGADDTVSGL